MAQLKITLETYLDGTDEKETLQIINNLLAHDIRYGSTPTKSKFEKVEDDDSDPEPLVITSNGPKKEKKKKAGRPPSADTVKQAIKEFAQANGNDVARKIISEFGATKFPDISKDDYRDLLDRIKNFDGDVTEDDDDDLEL